MVIIENYCYFILVICEFIQLNLLFENFYTYFVSSLTMQFSFTTVFKMGDTVGIRTFGSF